MKWFLTFFVIHALIVQLNSFATKESYAKLTPISFGNTKFHDTQTKTALCITQYKYLKRNTNLTLPPEPKKYDECPYERFFQDYKNYRTTFELFLKDARDARDNLVSAATAPDDCISFCGMRNDPTFHFDGEDYIQLTNERVIMRRNNAISELKAFAYIGMYTFFSSAVELIGHNLHTVQDFYSHTNWIEMGNTDINPNVGMTGKLGVTWPWYLNTTSCSQCSKADMTAAENQTIQDLINSWWDYENFKHSPCAEGNIDYVFVCRNNVITNALTSGFYGSESNVDPKPNQTHSKCSHGGAYDTSAIKEAKGGISKDADTLFFAPHYYLHLDAARVSVDATIKYMEDIRLTLNDENLFGKLIGLTPYIGIGIVIDTTQSMKRHWNDVITGITEKLKKLENDFKITTTLPQYYLTEFNDPGYKNVYQTSNPYDILQTLSSITPSGGGDIPEMCYPALLNTVNEMLPGSAVFVYTDAISKKEELLGQIKTVAAQKKITISFIMLGENESNSNKTNCCFCTFSSGLCQYSCCSSGHVEFCNGACGKCRSSCPNDYCCEKCSCAGEDDIPAGCVDVPDAVDLCYNEWDWCNRKALIGSAHSKEVHYFRNYFKPSIRNVTKNEANDVCSFDKEPNIEISLLSDYKDLATFTNGYYVAVMNKNDTKNIVAGMNGRTDWQTVNAAVAFDITTTSLNFAVDDTMKYLEIRIISLYGDSISDLMLNVTLGGKEIFSTDESLISDTMRVIDFVQPSTGIWKLEITNILSQTLSIFVRCPSVLDLNMRMLSSFTSGTMGQPTVGEMYNIYVECPNCKTVDKIIVKLCADYSVQFEGNATYLQSFEWWYLENVTLPAEMICIQVQGTTLNGNAFSRIIDKKVLPSTIAIRGSMIPLEIYSNQTGSLKFIIINNGTSDTFNVTLNNSAGSTLSFYQQSYYIDSFSSANDTVQISINDSSITTVNIELTITSQNMPVQSNFATFYLNVLPMNPDLDAPICEIISDDNSSCIETCIANTYKVQVQFYDNITGIARASYTNGQWNIPNNNTFGNGDNNNITYTATGIISCCENNTEFYVFDQNGLIGKCEFTNNPTLSTLLPTSSTEKPTKSDTNYQCSKYSAFLGFFIFIIYNVLF